jgi:hypothetical protein
MTFGRGNRRASALAMAVLAAVLLLTPVVANAATVSNGTFETNNLSGWQVSPSAGGWQTYSGTTGPNSGIPISAPPQGTFAAITDVVAPDTRILYQDLVLEPGFTHKLSLFAYYRSSGAITIPAPDTLDSTGSPNQQYRIDVIKPGAPLNSLSPSDILLNVFQTKAGDPTTLPPTAVTADLTPFAGQTVRLRMAEVDNLGVFNAMVDAVSLTSTKIPNEFTFGTVKHNKKKGTATLAVSVPGPGTLSLTGKNVKPQRPAREATASTTVGAAGTVKLLVKAKGKAKKKLNKTGKAKVKVKVTYTPSATNGNVAGDANTQTKTVKLVKKLG